MCPRGSFRRLKNSNLSNKAVTLLLLTFTSILLRLVTLSHHRALKMMYFLVSYFFAQNLVNKDFSAFVDVIVSSADAFLYSSLYQKHLIIALRENLMHCIKIYIT